MGQRNTIDGFTSGAGVNWTPQAVHAAHMMQAQKRAALAHSTAAVFPRHVAAPAARCHHAASRLLRQVDMELPGVAEAPLRRPRIRKHLSIFRHWAFRASVVMLVLLVGAGGILLAQGVFSAQKVFKGSSTAAALRSQVDPNMLKGEGDGRVNILLAGVGGAGHDGADLTDTMIVASIDPVNKVADLVSVPRDLWVKVPGFSAMKINAAYAMGKYEQLGKTSSSNQDTEAVMAGFRTMDATVESVLGIDIHYNILVNFQAFRQAVDTVGGVDINVPERLYDPSMAWENGWNATLAEAGPQKFDGKQALLYVRSRHTSSDFARSERQRAVILALKQKVVNLGTLSNPLKLSQLMSAFGDNVVTDLSLNDASRLYALTKDISGTKFKSIGLVDEPNKLVTTGRVGNQSVVLPKAGMFEYDAIQQFIRSSLPDGYIKKENSRIKVLNGTMATGLAEEKAADLKTYGYNIVGTGNAPQSVYEKSVLVDLTGGRDKFTRHYLEQRFGIQATTKLPDSTLQKTGADFILIIGNDETSRS